MISRRRFLGTVGGLGTIAIAGCADSESTSEIELVESDFEADSDSFIGLFEFENESEEEDSIEFSTEVQIGTDGVYGTHRNDTTVTVPGEDSVTEEILLADRTRLSEAEDNELANGYRTISLFIDGNETENVAIGDQPSRHVSFRVLYDGTWQGAMGEEGSTRTIQGAGNSHLSVSDDAFIVSGNAGKQDDSSDELIVQIIVDGNVIAEEATTGGFGIAQVAAEPSESPLNSPRVPYEPEDVHLGDERITEESNVQTEDDDSEVPSEEQAVNVIERYFTAVDELDVDTMNELSHPDSLQQAWTDEDAEAVFGEIDIEMTNIEKLSLNEEEQTIVFRVESTISDGEETESFEELVELRVYQGEWRIF